MKTVYQISDCHLSDDSSFANFKHALEFAQNDDSCDTLLLTGDLCCNPKAGDYTRLHTLVERHVSSKTVYAIAGNHDDSVLMRKELKGSTIKVVDKTNIHGRNVLFLDSSFKPIDTRHPLGSGRIDKRGLAKLEKQLRKSKDAIVVVHHPVIPVGSEWMKSICMENDDKLLNTLSKRSVREVICGHGHDGLKVTKHGVTQYMAPATAYGFDHSIEEYNRSQKIGLSKITFHTESIDYQPIYL